VTVLDAVILAVIQGLTEFLPVSSSGHLVLGQHLLGIKNPEILTFDIFVHFGTLLSVVAVFWKDILAMVRSVWKALRSFRFIQAYKTDADFRTSVAIIVASVPAALIGILFRDQIAEAFTDPKLVAVNLVVTGLILFLTRLSRPVEGRSVGNVIGFFVGIAQAFAILPGISRSGSTISMGMFFGINPTAAARFSFLMSLPVILGATALETKDFIAEGSSIPILPTLIGTLVAAVTGYLAIKWLLRIVQRGSFSLFSFYCLALGVAGIIFI